MAWTATCATIKKTREISALDRWRRGWQWGGADSGRPGRRRREFLRRRSLVKGTCEGSGGWEGTDRRDWRRLRDIEAAQELSFKSQGQNRRVNRPSAYAPAACACPIPRPGRPRPFARPPPRIADRSSFGRRPPVRPRPSPRSTRTGSGSGCGSGRTSVAGERGCAEALRERKRIEEAKRTRREDEEACMVGRLSLHGAGQSERCDEKRHGLGGSRKEKRRRDWAVRRTVGVRSASEAREGGQRRGGEGKMGVERR